MSKKRSAEDTIKGFNYQFAATVLLILQSEDDSQITVEGIEDIDVASVSVTSAVQCKYYEGTKLTNSVLRDIVEPMLVDEKGRTTKIHYFIYAHFKEQVDLATFQLSDPAAFRADVLGYKKGKGEKQIIGNLADDIGLTNPEIGAFLARLRFTLTQNYDAHKRQVEVALEHQFSCNSSEVSHFYYPVAFSKVAELATKATLAERKITKSAFLKAFEAKHQLFKHWVIHEKGEAAFCKAMRHAFFSVGNISPFSRFFIVECSGGETLTELKSVALALRDKWSSYKKTSRLATKDRYAPYLLFRGAPPAIVFELLAELNSENIKFVDGFPFKGAEFSVAHLSQSQTAENAVSLRLLYDVPQLDGVLTNLCGQTKEIFEFYRRSHLPLNDKIRHVQIPIFDLSTVTQTI
jgi:hypothetical protein